MLNEICKGDCFSQTTNIRKENKHGILERFYETVISSFNRNDNHGCFYFRSFTCGIIEDRHGKEKNMVNFLQLLLGLTVIVAFLIFFNFII